MRDRVGLPSQTHVESRSALSKTVSHLGFSPGTDCVPIISSNYGLICPPSGIEELWFGISANTLEGQLMWEPACPVAAVVSLCQTMEEAGACVDLPHSSRNVSKGKVHFEILICLLSTHIIKWLRQEIYNSLSLMIWGIMLFCLTPI